MPIPKDKDEDSFDSELRGPKVVKKLVESLQECEIETELDRKLLMEVLERDCQQIRVTYVQTRLSIPQTNDTDP